jgi:hypothetical protein
MSHLQKYAVCYPLLLSKNDSALLFLNIIAIFWKSLQVIVLTFLLSTMLSTLAYYRYLAKSCGIMSMSILVNEK